MGRYRSRSRSARSNRRRSSRQKASPSRRRSRLRWRRVPGRRRGAAADDPNHRSAAACLACPVAQFVDRTRSPKPRTCSAKDFLTAHKELIRKQIPKTGVKVGCEAAGRSEMHFVPVKSAEQQANSMVLKVRETLIGQRTQLINTLRGHAAEF